MCFCDCVASYCDVIQLGSFLSFTHALSIVHSYDVCDYDCVTPCHIVRFCIHCCDCDTHTHPFNSPLSLTTWVIRYHKGKTISILLKQETVSGSGISWVIYKSAPRSRQTTMPAPQARCPSCHPTNSIKALKAQCDCDCEANVIQLRCDCSQKFTCSSVRQVARGCSQSQWNRLGMVD